MEVLKGVNTPLSRDGFVSPLSPTAVMGDFDLDMLADVTEAMLHSGYEPTRTTVIHKKTEATVGGLARQSLFNGGAERSEQGYQEFLNSHDLVIGPYVQRHKGQELCAGIALYKDLRAGMRRNAGDLSWGILGAGVIGSRVIDQLSHPEIASRSGLSVVPDFVLRKSGLYISGELRDKSSESELPDVDVLFVATPGIEGNDSPAYLAIKNQLGRRGLVITAEKASLAEHFEEFKLLSDNFKNMGINATVGGGTRLMSAFETYGIDRANINEAHFALNGTLSYILGQVSAGVATGIAVDEAVALGYAEPGATVAEGVIRGEATSDIQRKIAVVMNNLLLDNPVSAAVFEYDLADIEIKQALRESAERRFMVSVYNKDKVGADTELAIESSLSGFVTELENWVVIGGFQRVRDNPTTAHWANSRGAVAGFTLGLGPNNQDGVYNLQGPGAGPKPTANTMLDDAQRLIAAKHQQPC